MSEASAHKPVLLSAVVELLRPGEAEWIVDCTVGLGGHAEALLAAGGGGLIALDRDAGNLRAAKRRLSGGAPASGPPRRFFHGSFAHLREVLDQAGVTAVDALVADLGVASNQLADPRRGLSFLLPGPLDMRLDVEADGPTAADLVHGLSERELADLLYRNGQERRSRQIARAIVAARRRGPIAGTVALAEIVSAAVGGRRGAKIHPATRTFQALRIAVNDELGALDALLAALPAVLSPGGRAAIISFHSLEDRRVKMAFTHMKSSNLGRIVTTKPIVPDDEEMEANPRSRSAKLRCVQRN